MAFISFPFSLFFSQLVFFFPGSRGINQSNFKKIPLFFKLLFEYCWCKRKKFIRDEPRGSPVRDRYRLRGRDRHCASYSSNCVCDSVSAAGGERHDLAETPGSNECCCCWCYGKPTPLQRQQRPLSCDSHHHHQRAVPLQKVLTNSQGSTHRVARVRGYCCWMSRTKRKRPSWVTSDYCCCCCYCCFYSCWTCCCCCSWRRRATQCCASCKMPTTIWIPSSCPVWKRAGLYFASASPRMRRWTRATYWSAGCTAWR